MRRYTEEKSRVAQAALRTLQDNYGASAAAATERMAVAHGKVAEASAARDVAAAEVRQRYRFAPFWSDHRSLLF